MSAKKKLYKKLILTLSLCAILLWVILGASASLAWFTDTSPKLENIFHVAQFELEVSYRLEDGTYAKMDSQTYIFDDSALYEPGYVQVVYLKIENKGTVPFDLKAAVSVNDYTTAVNVYGRTFNIQDHLRFGAVFADTEAELENDVSTRLLAEKQANMPLNNYSKDIKPLEAGGESYMALIVRMPREVGNEANYRGDVLPRVDLGVIITATQQK